MIISTTPRFAASLKECCVKAEVARTRSRSTCKDGRSSASTATVASRHAARSCLPASRTSSASLTKDTARSACILITHGDSIIRPFSRFGDRCPRNIRHFVAFFAFWSRSKHYTRWQLRSISFGFSAKLPNGIPDIYKVIANIFMNSTRKRKFKKRRFL